MMRRNEGRTCIVDLSEEVEVLGVGTCDLGRDISDTESSGHGKVRDHGTGEDHGGKPAS
jgi:hypothetical protein